MCLRVSAVPYSFAVFVEGWLLAGWLAVSVREVPGYILLVHRSGQRDGSDERYDVLRKPRGYGRQLCAVWLAARQPSVLGFGAWGDCNTPEGSSGPPIRGP